MISQPEPAPRKVRGRSNESDGSPTSASAAPATLPQAAPAPGAPRRAFRPARNSSANPGTQGQMVRKARSLPPAAGFRTSSGQPTIQSEAAMASGLELGRIRDMWLIIARYRNVVHEPSCTQRTVEGAPVRLACPDYDDAGRILGRQSANTLPHSNWDRSRARPRRTHRTRWAMARYMHCVTFIGQLAPKADSSVPHWERSSARKHTVQDQV